MPKPKESNNILPYVPGGTPMSKAQMEPQMERDEIVARNAERIIGSPPDIPCSKCSGVSTEYGLEVYNCFDGSGPYYYSNVTINGQQIPASIIGKQVQCLPNAQQNCASNLHCWGPIWYVTQRLPTGGPNTSAQAHFCVDLQYKTQCLYFSPPCPYKIGDIGPGGGVIFAIPQTGNNNTNYAFEVDHHDVSTTQREHLVTGSGCLKGPAFGAEFGVYKEIILPSDNGTAFGDGLPNTIHLNSYPITGLAIPNPTNPVIDTHDLAAKLCADYVGPNGHTDWFLPSVDEARELLLNLGPQSSFANIAHLNTNQFNPVSEFYWTSSIIWGIGATSNALAAGFRAGTPQGFPSGGIPMERCTTGSVRPVRRFECPEVPSTGIDYNYRFHSSWRAGGILLNQYGGPPGSPSGIIMGYDVPGTSWLVQIHRLNVQHQWMPTITNGDTLTFELFDGTENSLGKWDYLVTHKYICGLTDPCFQKFKMSFVTGSPPLWWRGINFSSAGQTQAATEAENIQAYWKISCSKPSWSGYQYGNTLNLQDYCGTGINLRHTGNFGYVGNNPYGPTPPHGPYYWQDCSWCNCPSCPPTSGANNGYWPPSPPGGQFWRYVCEVPPPNGALYQWYIPNYDQCANGPYTGRTLISGGRSESVVVPTLPGIGVDRCPNPEIGIDIDGNEFFLT